MRTLVLTRIFIKEQLKEPIALFWIMISPCAFFYFLAITRQDPTYFENNYILTTGWFYAYISSSVALFGFSFYIIGRRESGFIRSFIYTPSAKTLFLRSHLLAYSIIAISYCGVFYLITRPMFGSYDIQEISLLTTRFYASFLLFSIIGMLFTLFPINFQNSSTFFSILSFCMLILGVMGAQLENEITNTLNILNPLTLANKLMSEGLFHRPYTSLTILLIFISSYQITKHNLRINPVWSRY